MAHTHGRLNASYHRAVEAAEERERLKSAKKDRAAKRAALRAQATSVPSVPQTEPTRAPVPSVPSVRRAAQKGMTKPQEKSKWCICHPPGTAPAEMHGLCRKSVDSLRFTRPSKLPSDVVGVFRERAELIAWKIKPAKNKTQLMADKMADKDVAEFVAGNIVKKSMSYEDGIKAAMPELKTSAEIGEAINVAKQAPMVQQAINDTLKKRGLDGDSKDYFVQKMWKWLESTNPAEERLTLQAARIFSEAFVKGQQPSSAVATLKIEGIGAEEGLRAMFAEDYDKLKDLQPVAANVAVEDFDESDFTEDED